jgi:hypothetical protein
VPPYFGVPGAGVDVLVGSVVVVVSEVVDVGCVVVVVSSSSPQENEMRARLHIRETDSNNNTTFFIIRPSYKFETIMNEYFICVIVSLIYLLLLYFKTNRHKDILYYIFVINSIPDEAPFLRRNIGIFHEMHRISCKIIKRGGPY